MIATLRPYDLPLRTPWRGAHRRWGLLVRLADRDLVGWGEAAPDPNASPSERGRMEADLRRAINEPTATAKRPETRHALVTAGLDLASQRETRPLWRMLSPSAPERVPINAVLPILPLGASVPAAKRLLREGYTTLKLKVTGQASEPQRVLAVREALGPRVRLRVDPNAAWTPALARRRLEALAPANLEYVEQPVRRSRDLESVAANSPIPIAPDESMEDPVCAGRWLREGTFPFAILKPTLVGGLDRVRDLVRDAGKGSTRVTITDRLESAVGRMAALHAAFLLPSPAPACGLDGGRWFASDTARLPPIGPYALRPTRPGLGVAPADEVEG